LDGNSIVYVVPIELLRALEGFARKGKGEDKEEPEKKKK
jgi:hypothetical protein